VSLGLDDGDDDGDTDGISEGRLRMESALDSKSVCVNASTLDARTLCMNSERLMGTFGRTVGALLGNSVGCKLDVGLVLGVGVAVELPNSELSDGSEDEFEGVVWLDMVISLLG